jgi:hypothetical protein
MKMRIACLALGLAAATLAVPASAQSFVGRWTATAQAPDGPVSEELVVTRTEQGYAITAKLIGELPPGIPQAGPGTDIELEGDSFAYKRSVTLGEQVLVVTYTGTVTGDTFTGAADIAGYIVPYTGVRSSMSE